MSDSDFGFDGGESDLDFGFDESASSSDDEEVINHHQLMKMFWLKHKLMIHLVMTTL